MKIQKLSHCCMVVDVNDRKILIDPGFYSIEQHDKLNNIDIVLITHEHVDHFHIESLKSLIKRIPDVTIITNDTVGDILVKEGITHHIMKHGDVLDTKDIHIEAYGEKHASMHSSIHQASNIGFYLSEVRPRASLPEVSPRNFFFPGDAFTDPLKKIDILALPVAGPWMKLSEAIDYALKLKPRIAFPVHDALHTPSQHIIPEKILGANGIEFVKLEDGGVIEI